VTAHYVCDSLADLTSEPADPFRLAKLYNGEEESNDTHDTFEPSGRHLRTGA